MAKVVWKTTPKASYEWVEVEGGDTMRDYERKALLDDFIEENGLVPVETTFVGESPTHKYGRYLVAGSPAMALAPTANGNSGDDLNKAKAEADDLRAQLARALAQIDKKPASKKADVVDSVEPGIGSPGSQDADDARMTLNQQDGVAIVGSGEEVREDMSTADRSDDNPKRGPGRPRNS